MLRTVQREIADLGAVIRNLALIAVGVAVYTELRKPDGVDKAFAMLDKIKPHVVWWTSSTKGFQNLAAGEVVMNVNFPDLPAEQVTEVEVTRQGQRDFKHMHAEKRTDLRGRDYYWMGFKGQLSNPPAGTDLRAIYDGKISITPLHIDLTHGETVNTLRGLVGGAPPKLD